MLSGLGLRFPLEDLVQRLAEHLGDAEGCLQGRRILSGLARASSRLARRTQIWPTMMIAAGVDMVMTNSFSIGKLGIGASSIGSPCT